MRQVAVALLIIFASKLFDLLTRGTNIINKLIINLQIL